MSRNAELIAAALAARARAYAPYSGYAVGAAMLGEDGAIYVGCNVENAAYPAGTCAEAGAIAALIAGGARRVLAAAVAGPQGSLCTPCGSCRQRLREFAGPEAPVLVCDLDGLRAEFTVGALLPASFGPENLARD